MSVDGFTVLSLERERENGDDLFTLEVFLEAEDSAIPFVEKYEKGETVTLQYQGETYTCRIISLSIRKEFWTRLSMVLRNV